MDITNIRDNNIKDILNSLRFNMGLTKKDIADKTGLSFSTVSSACNVLIEKGIMQEKKVQSTNVGRLPRNITFNYKQFCSVALDLQNRNLMDFTVIDFNNDVLYHSLYNVAHCFSAKDVINYAFTIFKDISKYPTFDNVQCVGLGIAVPGIFDQKAGKLINSSISYYEGASFVEIAEDVFGVPCYVDTGSNFCALSVQQKEPNANNFVYINISSEISAGVICQDKLVTGQSGHALRVAHLPLGNESEKCSISGCQNYGCIYNEISLKGMVGEYLSENTDLSLLDRWLEMIRDMRSYPQKYNDYFKEKGKYIGNLIATLVCIFDPATVYLGGHCLVIYDLLEPAIWEVVKKRCPLACQFGLQLLWDVDSNETLYKGINQSVYNGWNPLRL
ncbi:MAG: ROK family transcriptional regulator [Sedimentibacter sp.]|uniref:ROK family transcriptional regulator n=1 Tax=Sedimentibacter sp. TaxID=1960295 RepID=UPI003159164D